MQTGINPSGRAVEGRNLYPIPRMPELLVLDEEIDEEMRTKPSVTQILDPFYSFPTMARGHLAAAMMRGTVVDQAAAAYVRGLPSIVFPEYQGHVDSFCSWFDSTVLKVILNHERLYAPDFHGELDFVFIIKGDVFDGTGEPYGIPSLWDLKTPIQEGPTWCAQIAAYKYLVEKIKGIMIGRCYALQTQADGSIAKATEYTDSPRDLAAFMNAKAAWRYFNGT